MIVSLSLWVGAATVIRAALEQHEVDRSALAHVEKLEEHVQAVKGQTDKAVAAATDAVVKAMAPQIEVLSEQNERSIADRAHITTKLEAAEKNQDRVQKALERAQVSFNEAAKVLSRIEKQSEKVKP